MISFNTAVKEFDANFDYVFGGLFALNGFSRLVRLCHAEPRQVLCVQDPLSGTRTVDD
jgi:hypothetical protein